MLSEKNVNIADRIYECRDAAKFMHGNDYKSEIKPYEECIHAYMKKYGCNEVEAAFGLVQDIKNIEGEAMTSMHIYAACVEVIEKECKSE